MKVNCDSDHPVLSVLHCVGEEFTSSLLMKYLILPCCGAEGEILPIFLQQRVLGK